MKLQLIKMLRVSLEEAGSFTELEFMRIVALNNLDIERQTADLNNKNNE